MKTKPLSETDVLYRDPNTLHDRAVTVGIVGDWSLSDDEIEISGSIALELVEQHDLQAVAALDGARRFVCAAPIAGRAWTARVRKTSSGKDNAARRLQTLAYGAASDFAYKIRISSDFEVQISAHVARWLPQDTRDVPSLQKALEKVTTDAVSLHYVTRLESYQTIARTGSIGLNEEPTERRKCYYSALSSVNHNSIQIISTSTNKSGECNEFGGAPFRDRCARLPNGDSRIVECQI